LQAVDSTQRYAADLVDAGTADGTVVVAETQTKGRGRRGRVWKDAPGASLLVSVVLRTTLPPVRLPTLSIAAGVAVAETIRTLTGLDARLKWPNDVLVGGRKIAGVLLERHGAAVILGIGINVTRDAVPPELATYATSIAGEGASADREKMLAALLAVVAVWRGRLEREGFEPIQSRWMALAGMLGRPVAVDGVAGTALGIDADGALLVQTESGSTRVLAGDVVELATG
jgi:BirA family biotin operon repressor/biotin-[acetyl-CoA-carboxylase] ligase